MADRQCPYSGVQISVTMLLSDEVEVEHILPFSQTLDDSLNNKTVEVFRVVFTQWLSHGSTSSGLKHKLHAVGFQPGTTIFVIRAKTCYHTPKSRTVVVM